MVRDKIFVVDFDGTCVEFDYPNVGKDIGAPEVLRELVANGNKIILNTMRDGKFLQDAVDWFTRNGIELFGVNENPTQGSWTTSKKIYSHYIIDDTAIGCPMVTPKNGRPYVDWRVIRKILKRESDE